MLNGIPVIGWIISFVIAVSASVPFWIFWNGMGLGAKFFYFLPGVYHSPTLFECTGVFICVAILKWVMAPKLAYCYNNSESKS